MTTENSRADTNKVQLNDADLADATGGYITVQDEATGKYYVWKGKDANTKYVCPKCGRPVKAGFMNLKFYCDPCDDSWFFESNLNPNLNGGWKEISEAEYNTINGGYED